MQDKSCLLLIPYYFTNIKDIFAKGKLILVTVVPLINVSVQTNSVWLSWKLTKLSVALNGKSKRASSSWAAPL